ncbi:TetR/AcrR family transcriptional regulator [Janthinobacterium fluminis]|uniref:TetR/AcrR family transcriptional regulator n=1 Tax=Janthinobacterium fluminis TaxID=2987524 RepID=A0ABT5JUX1_9BURK|nr:TetR/AcrR family transcriptional regulator [Janthinobacterium fluminis]MDC8756547.1 TetR/AcrR family transcriptional regulator [Janthinobacterium fluminis]
MSTEYKDVRQHILDTGMAIISGKGYAAVGLNEILTSANVPKGSFYHYFKSKEAFGEALLDYYVTSYLAHLDEVLRPDGTPAARRLMAYWSRWRDTQSDCCPDGKCLVVKLAGEVSDMSEAMRLALLRGTTLICERLAASIVEGVADGSLPGPYDAPHTAVTLYQMWLGASLLTKIRRDRNALEAAMLATAAMLKLPADTIHA